MKFLILSQYAGAPEYGMVLRNYNWAKALVDLGHEVTIVGSAFSHYRAEQPPSDGKQYQEIIDGVKFIWLKSYKYDGKSNLKRLSSMAQYCLQLFTIKIKTNYDVVVASSPQPFTIFPAVKLAKKMKAKLIYDIRDLWPLTPIHLGGFSPKHPLIRFMQRAEDVACKKADIIAAVPENAQDYLKERGMQEDKFIPIGNGFVSVPNNDFEIADNVKNEIVAFKSKHDFIITYIGAMGRANALDSLIKAIRISSENIGCILIGDGPLKQDLKNIAKKEKIEDRILFLDFIPLKEVPDFLSYVDACYCGLMNSKLFEKGVSPTKINDYMLAKKPIIFAVGYEANTVAKAEAGYSCEPENIKDIADKIEKLANLSVSERQAMGERGYQWVLENHMVSAQMEKILKKLNDIQ